jgi:hypothetical protein
MIASEMFSAKGELLGNTWKIQEKKQPRMETEIVLLNIPIKKRKDDR